MKLAWFCVVLSFLNLTCSEDFQLTEPYKDVPVIYGFIKNYDSAQYIRVERLFVDENIPAIDLAKIVDSIYYKNASVQIENVTTKKIYNLVKVNMVDEGYTRDTGNFATAPNYMYKIKTADLQLIPGQKLKLVVSRGDNSPKVVSEITLVQAFDFLSPPPGDREIEIVDSATASYTWRQNNDVGVFNFEMDFKIFELDRTTNKSIEKRLRWKLGRDLSTPRQIFETNEMYAFLQENLEENLKYDRELLSVELIVFAGGIELKTFNEIRNANLGITASQEIPRYTNLSEGFGLFTNVYELRKSYFIGPKTKESLRDNVFTRRLGFK